MKKRQKNHSVSEAQLIDLAIQRGWLGRERAEAVLREHSGLIHTPDPGDWRILSLLVEAGDLSLEQLELLAREQSGGEDRQEINRPGPIPEPVSPSAAESTDRYRIEGLLGSGGMGEVYKAFDRKLGRTVALKRLKSGSDVLNPRLQREAQLQSRLDHENICRIYDIVEEKSGWSLSMQYIEGRTLDKAAVDMGLEEKVRVMARVAEALHAAHRQGLVHRDVKPANIMVEMDENGSWKPYVTDFGLVREVSRSDLTLTGEMLGSPRYMSPEQVRGDPRRIDRRSDIFSLGIVLYESLSGELPFQGETPALSALSVLQHEPRPLRRVNRSVPVDLETVVMKCLEKERRYGSARELAADLERYLDGEPVQARPVTLTRRTWKKVKKHRALSLTVAVSMVLLLVLGGGWLAAQRRSAGRARLAERFGREVAEIRSILRIARLLPAHDIRGEQEKVRERLGTIESRMKQLGRLTRGPGQLALGQGYAALGEYEKARAYLESKEVQALGTDEARRSLGMALGELYRQKLGQLQSISDTAVRETEQKKLQRELAVPAMRMLQNTGGGSGLPAAYAGALIAFYEGRYEEALKELAMPGSYPPDFYERDLLAGDIHLSLAIEQYWHRGTGDFLGHFQAAEQAFLKAADTARSDPRIFTALSELYKRWGYCEMYGANRHAPELFEKAVKNADIAISIDTASAAALRAKADALYYQAAYNSEYLRKDTKPTLNKSRNVIAKVLKNNPTDVESLFIIGKTWWFQASRADRFLISDPFPLFKTAKKNFEKAMKINPNNYNYRNLYALSLSEESLSRFNRGLNPFDSINHAIKSFSFLSESFPDSYQIFWNWGWASRFNLVYLFHSGQEKLKNFNKVSQIFKRAIELNPTHSDNIKNFGFFLVEKAQVEVEMGIDPRSTLIEAEQYVEHAREIGKDGADELDINSVLCKVWAERAAFDALHGADPRPLFKKVRGLISTTSAKGFSGIYISIFKIAEVIVCLERWNGTNPTSELALALNVYREEKENNLYYFEFHDRFAQVLIEEARYRVECGWKADAVLDEVEAAVDKAMGLKKDDFWSRRLRAEVYLLRARAAARQGGDWEKYLNEAGAEMERSLKLNARRVESWMVRAECDYWRQRLLKPGKTEALDLLEKAVAAVDKGMEVNNDFGEAYLLKGYILKEAARLADNSEKRTEYQKESQTMLQKAWGINRFLRKYNPIKELKR